MNTTAILFLNGKLDSISNKFTNQKIYCTDGAVDKLKVLGIVPDVVIGDMDSAVELPSQTKVVQLADQDTTDFEKALQYLLSTGYTAVEVWGASGEEQDHFLGNLSAALQFKDKINIRFFDEYATYYFLKKENTIEVKKDCLISLFPFPLAKNITTKGLQYPLFQEDLALGNRIGTRNKSTDSNIEINFEEGEMLIFIGK